jgi:DNA (cytosine-5)-methyltransferase 1
VFVVGYLGDWRRPAKVLFESESVRRDSPQSREARQGAAAGIGGGPDGGRIAGAVTRKWSKGSGGPAGDECYNMVAQPVAFDWQSGGDARGLEPRGTAQLQSGQVPAVALPIHYRKSRRAQSVNDHETWVEDAALAVSTQPPMQVRRLTPVECERLQGFPDNYTNIPWRKKPDAPDGPRYKALGNSMAVPVMRWIGERIKQSSGD